jgi:ubiquinol-cytochrome c reductase cytochrome c1 subunit
MMRYILALILVIFSNAMWAEEPVEGLVLAKAPVNINDVASIKRGAKTFAATCMVCHTMVYLRYDKLAEDAGVTYEKMPINVKTWPNGVTPPDLSLEADVRGADWIYTYLHSFYQDTKRPTGANNLLVPGTAMPAILSPYQGQQALVTKNIQSSAMLHQLEWYDLVELTSQGSMTPEQFDGTVADLVNFMVYAAAPYRAEQESIGYWVLGFLVILFVMMYALKREYWKDVKKRKE